MENHENADKVDIIDNTTTAIVLQHATRGFVDNQFGTVGSNCVALLSADGRREVGEEVGEAEAHGGRLAPVGATASTGESIW